MKELKGLMFMYNISMFIVFIILANKVHEIFWVIAFINLSLLLGITAIVTNTNSKGE